MKPVIEKVTEIGLTQLNPKPEAEKLLSFWISKPSLPPFWLSGKAFRFASFS
ncbi:hypothetical protein [Methanosarcina sp. MTP4]|uniref:hypothetical protein n=1 Tax=Methanosarcina sp. MTP4 TaxID=1434100 RepID=UPI000A7F25FF|nr:hypothetical protein [Methanosarcina sp. MTP4]